MDLHENELITPSPLLSRSAGFSKPSHAERQGLAQDTVVLRSYHDEVTAQLDAMVLEANGIPARVVADTVGGMMPSIALVFPVRLLVRAVDAKEARELLDSSVD